MVSATAATVAPTTVFKVDQINRCSRPLSSVASKHAFTHRITDAEQFETPFQLSLTVPQPHALVPGSIEPPNALAIVASLVSEAAGSLSATSLASSMDTFRCPITARTTIGSGEVNADSAAAAAVVVFFSVTMVQRYGAEIWTGYNATLGWNRKLQQYVETQRHNVLVFRFTTPAVSERQGGGWFSFFMQATLFCALVYHVP